MHQYLYVVTLNPSSCHFPFLNHVYTFPFTIQKRAERWIKPKLTFLQATLPQFGAQNVSFWRCTTGCLFLFFSFIFSHFAKGSNNVFYISWGSKCNESVEASVSHPHSPEQDLLYSGRLWASTEEQLEKVKTGLTCELHCQQMAHVQTHSYFMSSFLFAWGLPPT